MTDTPKKAREDEPKPHTELRRQGKDGDGAGKTAPRPRAKVVPGKGDDELDDLFNDMPV